MHAIDLLSPDQVVQILSQLALVPYVGVAIVFCLKWTGIFAAVMTAVSVMVESILKIPEVVARFSGAPALEAKIRDVSDKILYWLKFFSIRNAQKPKDEV